MGPGITGPTTIALILLSGSFSGDSSQHGTNWSKHMGLGVRWTLHGDGRTPAPGAVVRPDERLSWPRTIGLGAQHVVAMFGASFVAPSVHHGT